MRSVVVSPQDGEKRDDGIPIDAFQYAEALGGPIYSALLRSTESHET